MADSEVLIIGAGPAGLSTAGALARLGIRSRLLEQDALIGGSWLRRYAALHLHTLSRFSGLAHWPLPQTAPRYVSRDSYAAYLQGYAAHFALDVALDTPVEAVRRDGGTDRWAVVANGRTELAHAVVMATGLYARPVLPRLPGAAAFAGAQMHASGYDQPAPWRGQRVLIVGFGNSGAEIAADLAANGAAAVGVSIRTPPPVVAREMFGCVPVQLFGLALSPLGFPRVVDRVSSLLRRIGMGKLERWGLPPAAWGPFTAQRPAVIDTGFLRELKAGRITIHPATVALDVTGARFADGSRCEADLVIWATGYQTGLEALLGDTVTLSAGGRPSPASCPPGLYCVGFTESIRGQLFEINRESRQVAAKIRAARSAQGCSGC